MYIDFYFFYFLCISITVLKGNLSLSFTESQNHRMFGVGRDLCGSSSPTPLPKQGHLQQAAQDLVQAGLEYLQRRRLHNPSGQPVQQRPPWEADQEDDESSLPCHGSRLLELLLSRCSCSGEEARNGEGIVAIHISIYTHKKVGN